MIFRLSVYIVFLFLRAWCTRGPWNTIHNIYIIFIVLNFPNKLNSTRISGKTEAEMDGLCQPRTIKDEVRDRNGWRIVSAAATPQPSGSG